MASEPLLVATEPRSAGWIDAAVVAGGGVVADPSEATAVVWTRDDDRQGLADLLDAHRNLGWVQLPWAGVDPYRALIAAHRDRQWTSAKGVYSDPVAEHALAMLLAGFRQLHRYSRASSWGSDHGRNLFGAKVTILGGGGIAQVLIDLLAPFRCSITVVRNRPAPMPGVDRVVGTADLDQALDGTDALVLALPLLESTREMIGASQLGLLAPGAWVVNVARGAHVVTDDLVDALESGHLGGAALDVTDPEPLPDDHALWQRSDVIITPHTANTRAMAKPLLGARITENVRRFGTGEHLVGVIDPDLGY